MYRWNPNHCIVGISTQPLYRWNPNNCIFEIPTIVPATEELHNHCIVRIPIIVSLESQSLYRWNPNHGIVGIPTQPLYRWNPNNCIVGIPTIVPLQLRSYPTIASSESQSLHRWNPNHWIVGIPTIVPLRLRSYPTIVPWDSTCTLQILFGRDQAYGTVCRVSSFFGGFSCFCHESVDGTAYRVSSFPFFIFSRTSVVG